MTEDITFIVHKEWLDNIAGLPVEQQDMVIAEIIRYGTGLPSAHEDDAVVQSLVNMTKNRIDFSKDKYAQKVEAGKTSGRRKKVDDDEVWELAQTGKTSAEIANIVGCSKSTIDHCDGWKKRNDPNFRF